MVLSFHHVCSEDETQFTKFGHKGSLPVKLSGRPFCIFKRTVPNSEESIKLFENIHSQSLSLMFISKFFCGFSSFTTQSLQLRVSNSGDGGHCA